MFVLALLLTSPVLPPAAVIARSAFVASIPSEVRLAEAIAFDRDHLVTGSVLDGGIWRQESSGWRRMRVKLPVGGVYALATTPDGSRLWASIGSPDPFEATGKAFRGLVEIDLQSLKIRRYVPMPEGAAPGDLAVAPDGAVYVSDQANGGLYRCQPNCRIASRLVGKDTAPSPQGIAVSPKSGLYLADHARGIFWVDPETGRAELLRSPMGAELRGIDGLIWWRGQLIGIQNGTGTKRILRIVLDRTGRAATLVEPIEQGHPEWGEPTLAALAGDRLFYIADAQWEEWEKGGVRKAGVPLRPTAVRVVKLRP